MPAAEGRAADLAMSLSHTDRRQPLAEQLRSLGRGRARSPRAPQYTRAQILEILRAAQHGALIKDLCREHAITDSTFYRWRTRYGKQLAETASAVSPEQKLRQFAAENRRLRKRLTEIERLSA